MAAHVIVTSYPEKSKSGMKHQNEDKSNIRKQRSDHTSPRRYGLYLTHTHRAVNGEVDIF